MPETTIEEELGQSLIWDEGGGNRMCRVYLRRQVDMFDRDAWPEHYEWLLRNLVAMRKCFVPIVKSLDVAANDMPPEE